MKTDQLTADLAHPGTAAMIATLVADADGHQHDRYVQREGTGPANYGFRQHWEITPGGELVSAHRSAL